MTIKKRGGDKGETSGGPRPASKGGGAPAKKGPRTASSPGRPGARPAVKKAAKKTVAGGDAKRVVRRAPGPRIRASHAGADARPAARGPRRPIPAPSDSQTAITSVDRMMAAAKVGRDAPLRKAPLTGPKRAVKRASTTEPSSPEASAAARELALAVAGAGLEKKAIGIEILDVSGRVDYADFLVIMTGRSDRHVHAIATGLEESMRRRKLSPLSMEGLSAATWVLIDFGDVVVHVFQEEARLLYDIEGLWIDASRVPVPAEEGAPADAR